MKIKGWKYYKHAAVPDGASHLEPDLAPVHDGRIWKLAGGLVLFVRYTTDFDKKEASSFWYVNKDSFGGMEELSSKMRNQVKKSLKQLDIRRITKEEMLQHGYDVYKSATENYKVKTHIPTIEEYEDVITNIGSNVDFWGAFIKDTERLIAFGYNEVSEDSCDYMVLKAIPFYKKQYYPYYGLIYEMNRFYLEEKGLKYVSDGSRSITEHSNIQPFLIEKFKFRKVYCTLHIEYRWWLKIIIGILYPFRKMFKNQQIVGLLNQEAMRREEM